MADPRWYKFEAEIVGTRLICELDEPERWGAFVMGGNACKRLFIYDKESCDTKLTLEAPTYRDLYKAAMFALNIHTMLKRGF